NGHAAAALPSSSVMNWRRPASSMGSLPEPAVPAYSSLRMPRKRPQVLGVDLKCSESSRQPACPRLSLPPPSSWRTPPSQPRALAAPAIDVGVSLFVLPEGEGPRHRLPTGAAAVLHNARATTAVRASYSGVNRSSTCKLHQTK